jgi:hypothetical protein
LFAGPQGIATDGSHIYVLDSGGSTIRVIDLSTLQVTTVAGTAFWYGGQDGAGAGPRFLGAEGLVFNNNALFIADTGNENIRKAVCGADDATNLVVAPQGNPTGPVTGVDVLDVSWSPPASGLFPTGYDWAINGDTFTAANGTSAVAPPRGTSDPITLHVRSHACNPDVTGTPVDSQTYSPAPPKASFTVSSSAPATNATVTFTDTSTPQATSWLWLFGDGSIATTQSATHSYSASGTYTAVLVASNGAGSSESSQTMRVGATGSAAIAVGAIRQFDAASALRPQLSGVTLSGPGHSWLHASSHQLQEQIVYLRLLDGSGRLLVERRLSLAPNQDNVYDLGAYSVRGNVTLELTSTSEVDAHVDGPRVTAGLRSSGSRSN